MSKSSAECILRGCLYRTPYLSLVDQLLMCTDRCESERDKQESVLRNDMEAS